MLLVPATVTAHGDLDQVLDGDRGCNSFNFPASASSSGTPRQQFVPSGALISSVGVCLETAAAGESVDIVVRAGTIGAPGAVVGVFTVSVPAGASFVHADFLSALPVTAGAPYVIEVAGTASIVWRGMPSSTDLYAAGSSSDAAIADFAFKSYLAPAAPATPTAQATATRAPSRTPSLTPTRTATAAPTVTPLPTAAPGTSPTAVVPEPTATATGAPATAPPAGVTPGAAPTRGIAVRGVQIRPPDVGDGAATEREGPPRTGIIIALATLGAAVAATGVALLRGRGRR